jgi:hypothetical protein
MLAGRFNARRATPRKHFGITECSQHLKGPKIGGIISNSVCGGNNLRYNLAIRFSKNSSGGN